LLQVASTGRAELQPVFDAMTLPPPFHPTGWPPAASWLQAPSRTEPETRPPHLEAADRQLAQYGWPQASAYRVYSAGDSFSGREEILFVAGDGRPRTARLGSVVAAGKRIEWLEVDPGW
jgi:hypothetical protein